MTPCQLKSIEPLSQSALLRIHSSARLYPSKHCSHLHSCLCFSDVHRLLCRCCSRSQRTGTSPSDVRRFCSSASWSFTLNCCDCFWSRATGTPPPFSSLSIPKSSSFYRLFLACLASQARLLSAVCWTRPSKLSTVYPIHTASRICSNLIASASLHQMTRAFCRASA